MFNHLGSFDLARGRGQYLNANDGGGTDGGNTDTGSDGNTGGGDGRDAAYWQAEAKKSFKDRDAEAKQRRALEARLKELESSGLIMTPEERAEQEKLKEERAKRTGDYEALKKQNDERIQKQIEKHTAEVKEWEEKHAKATARLRNKAITAAFGASTDLFGGHDQSKTILDVDMAKRVLGEYVEVDFTEDEDGQVIVKNLRGEPILGRDGNPAPFDVAMLELIDSLPNKNKIWRNSGKVGSGNGGGAGSERGTDLSRLRPADFADPKVREAVRRNMSTAGGLQIGRAFDAIEAQRSKR